MNNRDYGLDILRIISMCGIVGLHVLGAGGILSNLNFCNSNWIIGNFLEILFFSSVNLFAILTGYLYVKKTKISNKSLLNLLAIVLFYSVLITAIFSIIFPNIMNSFGMYLYGVFPILVGRYWYVSAYVFLFFMIPYLNFFVVNIEKDKLEKLLYILFLLLSVITIFLKIDIFKISNGYSPFWLVFCYLIGAYIHLYKDTKQMNRKYLLIVVNIVFILISFVLSTYLKESNEYFISNYFLLKYNSPFILINAILIFYLFKDINVNNKFFKNVILFLSKVSFSVYIIHSHILIYDYIINMKFVNLTSLNSGNFFFGIIISILCIYFICSIIDLIRMYCLKFLRKYIVCKNK